MHGEGSCWSNSNNLPYEYYERPFDGFALDRTQHELGYAMAFIYMATKTQKGTTERASMAKNTANYGNDSIPPLFTTMSRSTTKPTMTPAAFSRSPASSGQCIKASHSPS